MRKDMVAAAQFSDDDAGSVVPSAAVAVIRCQVPDESYLLVRRSSSPGDPWSGHFAFPGGRRDAVDETIFSTCLREVREETGILLDADALVTPLQPRAAGQRFRDPILVQPFLFEVEIRPEVRPDTREIASYLWLDGVSFRNRDNHIVTEAAPGIVRPVFPLADYYIWGFTYGLLCAICDVDAAR